MKGLKTLLCSFNSKFIHSNPAVYSLEKACDVYCNEYRTTCGCIVLNEFTINDLYDYITYKISSQKPDIIAIATYIWNVNLVSKLCKDIRKSMPDVKIVLGGPEVSFGVEHTHIKYDDYDYIIKGEGERSLFCLLASLNDKEFTPPKEFGFCIKDKVIYSLPINDLSQIPFIYDGHDIKEEFLNKIVYYESSRGCPFNCAYCLSAAYGSVRFLPLKRTLDDILKFIKSGIKQVKFVDRTFNCDRERAYEIINFIIQEASESDMNFHFEVGADLFDDRLISLLAKAKRGQIQLEIGIQSTFNKALEICCRKTSLEDLFYNIDKIIKIGNINVHVDLIAGLPGESYERFKKSFNDVYFLNAHQLQLGFLKLLKGAPLNELISEYDYSFSKNSPYEVMKNDSITYDEILKLKRIEDVLERYYNSRKFCKTLDLVVQVFDSPFDMYETLADFFEENGNTFKSVSSRELYDILFDFVCGLNVNDEFIDCAREYMLLDFFSSEHSENVPERLKKIWEPYALYKQKAKEILDRYKMIKDKNKVVRFVNQIPYIIDYSKKDPVTGCFNVIKCKQ